MTSYRSKCTLNRDEKISAASEVEVSSDEVVTELPRVLHQWHPSQW